MMPPEVIEIRHELCKCEGVNHADPCATCPNGHFGRYEQTGCDDPERVVSTGLGDKIATVAQPVARTIDRVLGTNVAGCGGCKQMQQNLNNGMSIKNAIVERLK